MSLISPKIVSPQLHRSLDMIALPGLFALTAWLSKRTTTAASLVLLNAVVEGTTQLVTDYTPEVQPRGRVRWLSLSDHLRITASFGAFLGMTALTEKGLQRQDRGVVLALATSALTIARLSDPGE